MTRGKSQADQADQMHKDDMNWNCGVWWMPITSSMSIGDAEIKGSGDDAETEDSGGIYGGGGVYL